MSTEANKQLKKRLLSTTAIILVALIVVIAANAVVWKNRLGKNSEIASLTGEINQVRQEIRKTPAPSPDLQSRLTAATANLTAAQAVFPAEFNRNDIIDYIIGLSRACQVEVLPITSQGWAVDKNDQTHSVLTLTGTITGSFTQANDFIYQLQHGDYKALVVPELSFTRVSGSVGPGAFSGDNTTVTVRMSINIYALTPVAKGTAP